MKQKSKIDKLSKEKNKPYWVEDNFDWILIVLAFLIGNIVGSWKLKWYWEILNWIVPLLTINWLLLNWKRRLSARIAQGDKKE